jgi:hypothetical protein
LVAALAALAACGNGGDGGEAAETATTREATPTVEVEAAWDCVATPVDLVELSEVVVVAEPTSEETTFSEDDPSGASRVDTMATTMQVVEVLAGGGVAEGDVIVVTRDVEHVTTLVDGEPEERLVTGDGFPGPPTAEGYILGLYAQGGLWTAIAGAHGRIALDGVGDGSTVLEPGPGDDGLLQEAFAGDTVGRFKERLGDDHSEAPCEDEHEHG